MLDLTRKILFNRSRVYLELRRTAYLFKRKGLTSAGFYLSSYLNPELYERYFEKVADEGYIRTHILDGYDICGIVDGFDMDIDIYDPGISRHLNLCGIHEEGATKYFSQTLTELTEITNNINIIEIGGNIGYYTLIEATVLQGDGMIYVVDPSPGNVELLERNITLNRKNDFIKISRGAISDSNGKETLFLSEHSNRHSLEGEVYSPDDQDGIETPTWTMDQFIENQEIPLDNINVIRMDVEGHEGKIFEEFKKLMKIPGPLLLFIELHYDLLKNEELEPMLKQFSKAGLEVAYVCNDYRIDGPIAEFRNIGLDTIAEKLERYENLEVFLKKGF